MRCENWCSSYMRSGRYVIKFSITSDTIPFINSTWRKKYLIVKLWIFSYPSVLTFVLGAQKNRLIEMVLLSTQNICFGREIKKMFICEVWELVLITHEVREIRDHLLHHERYHTFQKFNLKKIIKLWIISYPSVLTFVFGAQKNRLNETVHNTCFGWEIRKLFICEVWELMLIIHEVREIRDQILHHKWYNTFQKFNLKLHKTIGQNQQIFWVFVNIFSPISFNIGFGCSKNKEADWSGSSLFAIMASTFHPW